MHARLASEDFWSWLFEREVEVDDPARFEVVLPCGEQNGIRALVDEAYGITLADVGSGTELGWIDDAHWHPHCLRVHEVLTIAASQRGERTSAVAALLLSPFAVATTFDDAERHADRVAAAWEALGFRSEHPRPRDFCDEGVDWFQVDGAWWLREDAARSSGTLYTLRVEQNDAFPRWLSAL